METEHESGEGDALLPVQRSDEVAVEMAQPTQTVPPQHQPTSTTNHSAKDMKFESSNIVPVPTQMLQRIVEFCAQTLHETSESKRILQDLERGEFVSPNAPGNAPPAAFVETNSRDDVNNIFKLYSVPPLPIIEDPARRKMIEEAWATVEPWPLDNLTSTTISEDEAEEATRGLALSRMGQRYIPRWEYKDKAIMDILFATWPQGWHRKEELQAYTLFLKSHVHDSKYGYGIKWGGVDFDRQVLGCCASRLFEYSPDPPNFRIGHLLEACFSAGLFQKPDDLDSPHDLQLLLEHISQVIQSCILLNLIYDEDQLGGSKAIEFKRSRPGPLPLQPRARALLSRRRSLQEVLGIEVQTLFRILHLTFSTDEVSLESGKGATFRVDDLDVRSLRSIGNLSIQWTYVLENHLKLDVQNLILFVANNTLLSPDSDKPWWQEVLVRELPSTFLNKRQMAEKQVDSVNINGEIVRTWAFLFGTGGSRKKRASIHDGHTFMDVSGVRRVDNVQSYLRDIHLAPGLHAPADDYLYRSYNQVVRSASSKGPIPYGRFPLFETRLRQLRHYMDSQKPRGLRQLWKDNRDSLNYYTFWGVIVFGGLSVLLALFSLAVGVAQTYASFKALAGSSTSSSG